MGVALWAWLHSSCWMIRPTAHTLIHSCTHSTHPHTFMYPHAHVSFSSGDDVEYAVVYWKVLLLYMFVYVGTDWSDAGTRAVLREKSGYVSHHSFICAMTQPHPTRLLHMCQNSYPTQAPVKCSVGEVGTCHMTHSYVPWLIDIWRDSSHVPK